MLILFVLVCVVTLASGLKVGELLLSRPPSLVVWAGPDRILEEAVSNDADACMAWTERRFEQRLVDAGVIDLKEMTVCDVKACINCKPTRDALSLESRRKAIAVMSEMESQRMQDDPDYAWFVELQRTDPRYRGYRFEDWKFQDRLRKNSRGGMDGVHGADGQRGIDAVCMVCNKPGIHVHESAPNHYHPQLATCITCDESVIQSPALASNIVPLIMRAPRIGTSTGPR